MEISLRRKDIESFSNSWAPHNIRLKRTFTTEFYQISRKRVQPPLINVTQSEHF